jgi:uncharacterized protein YggT (Ycf19 family)
MRPRYITGDDAASAADEAATDIVEEDKAAVRTLSSSLALLNGLIGLVGIIVVAIIAFRMGFMMADANPNAAFVDFINRISGPLVHPFQGIMRNRNLDSAGVFEPASAYAIGTYLVAMLVSMLLVWALMPRRFSRQSVTIHHRGRIAHQH